MGALGFRLWSTTLRAVQPWYGRARDEKFPSKLMAWRCGIFKPNKIKSVKNSNNFILNSFCTFKYAGENRAQSQIQTANWRCISNFESCPLIALSRCRGAINLHQVQNVEWEICCVASIEHAKIINNYFGYPLRMTSNFKPNSPKNENCVEWIAHIDCYQWDPIAIQTHCTRSHELYIVGKLGIFR